MNPNTKKSQIVKTPGVHTIDIKHTELLNYYEKIENEEIPELEKEFEELKQRKMLLKRDEIDEYLNIKDNMNEIKEKIKRLKREKKDYLLNNSKHIFNFYEQKQQISADSNIVNQNT